MPLSTIFLWDFGNVPTVWHYLLFYGTMELYRQCGIICFSMGLWNCTGSVALFVFLWDFDTVPTVWHYLFFYGTMELFRQCGIICFSMGLWNCTGSVALFVFLWDFGTVPTVWHYLFFIVFIQHLLNLKCNLCNTVAYMNIYRVISRVTLVEQELIPLPEPLSSPMLFNGIRAVRSYVFCVVFWTVMRAGGLAP